MNLAHALGSVISSAVLTIFYFTVFALFAIPIKLFGDPLEVSPKLSGWKNKTNEFPKEEDFKYEF